MSDKNLDKKGRWRCVNVSFRVSPQENDAINMFVKTSGMTKQDYCVNRLLQEEVIIHPNIRIQKYLKDYLVELTQELKRLERVDGQSIDVLENIKYILNLINNLN